jgi:ATP-dependent exoDNAse (exonuclease V) beta subunit
MKPLVIRASAGTGKTYRLSLEFINLLLKYRINFDEILVITFTKKATAEIRERIFLQLHEIANDTAIGIELKHSIQQNINSEIQFNDEEMIFLQTVYHNMITNKSAVKISTIDSFVNTIFSGIIAPFHNITEFQIDNKINSEILPEIYEAILKDEKLKNYENIFFQAKRRNLDQFQQLITGIIENRWLFEFVDLSDLQNMDIETERDKAFQKYKSELSLFLDLLNREIIKKDAPVISLLQINFLETLSSHIDLSILEVTEFSERMFSILTNPDFLDENFKLILDDKNLWNGSKIRNKDLKDFYARLQDSLADFLFFDKALIEQLNIISLSADILQAYDEIKFRDKIFTHSDISYYTFRFLYDPQLSIVDKGNVLNVFYEQLSYKTRFVLIDEFQDTSILQWSIFKPMLKEITSGIGQKDYGNVIVVGDEKQAIYGWRGGERKLLTDIELILNEPVEYDTLSTSYRSKPILMDWLNKLFKSNFLNFVEDWDYTEIDCARTEGGFVQVDLRNAEVVDGIQGKLNKAEIYLEFIEQNLLPNLEDKKINPADSAILMRKNKELEIMAQVLDEAGIDYTLEMSGSLFQHKAIKPVLFILKFLVYEDFMELVKFLRSDLVLMNPTDLKTMINQFKNSKDLDDFLQNCDLHPCLNTLYKLKHHSDSLLNLIKTVLEEFGFSQVFSSEIERKNLQRFLEVAAEFERSNHEYTTNTFGFLQYCRSLAEKDEYSQIGQSVSDSIKLLTIHKSKGLQFETVFAVFDVTGKSGGNNSGLKLYYEFADNFHSLDDFAFTYNYDKIMQKSQKKELIESVQKRDSGDELNNIYVALTRAKNNLFIYLHYNKRGDLAKFIKGISTDASVLKQITNTIYHEFNNDLQESSQVHNQMQFGKLSTEPIVEDNKISKKLELPDYFNIFERENNRKLKKPDLRLLKTEFLQNQSILKGNIVHEFLTHIKYNDESELDLAFKKTLAKYGSLLHRDKLDEILQKVRVFMNENTDYFNKSHWDRVLNEYTIFDGKGKEFRIDRLMINTITKEILIVDFKTGSSYEEEQLNNYKKLIEFLPIVKRDNYRIVANFVEINL